MKKIFQCRRSSLALIGMCLLTFLGIRLQVDVSGSIAMIVMGIAAANAGEAAVGKIKENQDSKSSKDHSS